jgi:hypothetical protein
MDHAAKVFTVSLDHRSYLLSYTFPCEDGSRRVWVYHFLLFPISGMSKTNYNYFYAVICLYWISPTDLTKFYYDLYTQY